MARLSTVRCKVLAVHRRGFGEYFCRNGKGLYGSAAVEATVKGIAVGQVVTFKAIPSLGRLTCQRPAEGHTRGPGVPMPCSMPAKGGDKEEMGGLTRSWRGRTPVHGIGQVTEGLSDRDRLRALAIYISANHPSTLAVPHRLLQACSSAVWGVGPGHASETVCPIGIVSRLAWFFLFTRAEKPRLIFCGTESPGTRIAYPMRLSIHGGACQSPC
jgi:hypothetical protein